MRDAREVIIRPVVTEASAMLQEERQTYTFIVAKDSNKIEIRSAVQELFNVTVAGVRTANYPGKVRRVGRSTGRKSGYKKALVKLIEGDSIDVYEGVFDRIREQSRLHVGQQISTVMDLGINQTLSRTIITAFTTAMAALALVLFGGEVIHDFALAMVLGVLIGTYSSIFVASALALDMAKGERVEARS
jgi:large subunit ribosomal protein L23